MKLIDTKIEKHTKNVFVSRVKDKKSFSLLSDLYHVIDKCNGYKDMRKQKLQFVIYINRAEFYEKMNKLTKKELKLTAEFMQSVRSNKG